MLKKIYENEISFIKFRKKTKKEREKRNKYVNTLTKAKQTYIYKYQIIKMLICSYESMNLKIRLCLGNTNILTCIYKYTYMCVCVLTPLFIIDLESQILMVTHTTTYRNINKPTKKPTCVLLQLTVYMSVC